jgi:uncharacterized protein (DUF302 family)
MEFGYKKKVDLDFDLANSRVREELKKQGFGVITEIDVSRTLKEKINVDFDKYLILGACNPGHAHGALKASKDIGLMLPCNVVVYEDNGEVFVSAVNPAEMMKSFGSDELNEVAINVERSLKEAIDNL